MSLSLEKNIITDQTHQLGVHVAFFHLTTKVKQCNLLCGGKDFPFFTTIWNLFGATLFFFSPVSMHTIDCHLYSVLWALCLWLLQNLAPAYWFEKDFRLQCRGNKVTLENSLTVPTKLNVWFQQLQSQVYIQTNCKFM